VGVRDAGDGDWWLRWWWSVRRATEGEKELVKKGQKSSKRMEEENIECRWRSKWRWRSAQEGHPELAAGSCSSKNMHCQFLLGIDAKSPVKAANYCILALKAGCRDSVGKRSLQDTIAEVCDCVCYHYSKLQTSKKRTLVKEGTCSVVFS